MERPGRRRGRGMWKGIGEARHAGRGARGKGRGARRIRQRLREKERGVRKEKMGSE
jgi:hypothetical protein